MDDEIKPLLYCCRPRIPKFQCCLWAARLGPVDKKSNPERKGSYIIELLCNIECSPKQQLCADPFSIILLDLLAHFGWHRKALIFAAYIFMSGRRTAMFLCANSPVVRLKPLGQPSMDICPKKFLNQI